MWHKTLAHLIVRWRHHFYHCNVYASVNRPKSSRRRWLQSVGGTIAGLVVPYARLAGANSHITEIQQIAKLLDDDRILTANLANDELGLMLPARIQNLAVVPVRLRATAKDTQRLVLLGDAPLSIITDVRLKAPLRADISVHVRAANHGHIIGLAQTPTGWSLARSAIALEASACEVVRG